MLSTRAKLCVTRSSRAAGFGSLVYFELLDRLGPAEVTLVARVAPVFAALGGWLVLGGPLRRRTVVGFGLLERTALEAELDGVRGQSARRLVERPRVKNEAQPSHAESAAGTP